MTFPSDAHLLEKSSGRFQVTDKQKKAYRLHICSIWSVYFCIFMQKRSQIDEIGILSWKQKAQKSDRIMSLSRLSLSFCSLRYTPSDRSGAVVKTAAFSQSRTLKRANFSSNCFVPMVLKTTVAFRFSPLPSMA